MTQILSRKDFLFYISIFQLYSQFYWSFEHISARKTVLLEECHCWVAFWPAGSSLPEMDQNYEFGGTIDCGD